MAFELFRKSLEQSSGVMQVPQWDFIQRGYLQNLEKVHNYYTTFKQSVRSNHLLVRLLENIPLSKLMSIERYYANIDYIALNLAQAIGLTSHQSKGRLHRGVFYGANTPEFILAVDDYFNPEYVHLNWKNISAITPILHPKSDLYIQIPNGKDYSDEYGLAIVLINIPMLAIQYRAFYLEQLAKPDFESKNTIMQFIATYVLPNMIHKQMDLSLMNRIFNYFYDINPNINIKIKHPFSLMNYTDHVDQAIPKMLNNINKVPKRFINILKSLPAFNVENQYQNLMMPDVSPTRQVDWLLLVSRLKYLSLMVDIAGKDSTALNQVYINQSLRSLATYDSYQMFKQMLPPDVFFEYDAYVENILDSTNRKTFR